MYDAQSALDKMGKAHTLFKERREITGLDGSPLMPDVNTIRIMVYDNEEDDDSHNPS